MATELAKAYVQIVPSADGIKNALNDVLKDEVGGAGNAAGESFSGKMIGTIKKAVAAAGLGKVVSSALSEGADLQQSIGGIETLFKDSADTMKEYASQAYMTAGLSANDYMEQVTSFSASLLQGLGGDTAAAAESANQAIIDMADNANKMGSDIQSIQNAYQGFAKQNYTMLDNLKLGYGGTKTEMERLLADAQKISGIKYNIDNLDDVYRAIHVIQEDLGITGTTAEEAAETFSGSLSAMKAAGQNLLANLALGEDIGPSLTGLLDTVETFAVGNLLPMLGNVMSGVPQVLGGAISAAVRGMNLVTDNANEILSWGMEMIRTLATGIITGLPELANAAIQIFTSLGSALLSADWPGMANELILLLQTNVEAFASEILGTDGSIIESIAASVRERLPDILETGVETISSLAAGILQSLPTAVQSMGEIMNSLLGNILSLLPDILVAGADLIRELAQGIMNHLPEIASSAVRIVVNFIGTLLEHLPDILETGITLLGELIAGLIQSIPELVKGAGQIIERFKESFGEIDWGELGSNIISGIVNGLKNGISSIVDAAKDVAKSALNAAKDFLGINSPSKVMQDEVGKFIPSGIAVGIRKNVSPLTDAMDQLTKETTGMLHADVTASLSAGSLGLSAQTAERGGYTQNITINSPTPLSAYEVARQTRNATRNMVLTIQRA